jgi:hypothetical protein
MLKYRTKAYSDFRGKASFTFFFGSPHPKIFLVLTFGEGFS